MATIAKPVAFLSGIVGSSTTTMTVNLLSDGSEFYWIWTNSEKNSKIFMDVFTIQVRRVLPESDLHNLTSDLH